MHRGLVGTGVLKHTTLLLSCTVLCYTLLDHTLLDNDVLRSWGRLCPCHHNCGLLLLLRDRHRSCGR